MPSLYFIQTGKRIHERREQLHETLQMFGEAATAMYAGNILQVPAGHKSLYVRHHELYDEHGYRSFRGTVYERMGAHLKTYHRMPTHAYLDFEPERLHIKDGHYVYYLTTDFPVPSTTVCDIVMRTNIIRDVLGGVPVGQWSLCKHQGEGEHSERQMRFGSRLLEMLRPDVIFMNMYPRRHGADHRKIAEGLAEFWGTVTTVTTVIPVVQFRVKGEEMRPHDAANLVTAAMSTFGSMAVWMQCEDEAKAARWRSMHTAVAEAVAEALEDVAG
ncbi:MAG: hypothetical protein D6746_08560 [Bacteroidetes bacterium]|nr:MAG: hypothetical protein D6746_08560 [Bacteroidota bacterium]